MATEGLPRAVMERNDVLLASAVLGDSENIVIVVMEL